MSCANHYHVEKLIEDHSCFFPLPTKRENLLADTKGRKDLSQDFIRRRLARDLTEVAQRTMKSHENNFFAGALFQRTFCRNDRFYRSHQEIMMARVRDQEAFAGDAAVRERFKYSSAQAFKSRFAL